MNQPRMHMCPPHPELPSPFTWILNVNFFLRFQSMSSWRARSPILSIFILTASGKYTVSIWLHLLRMTPDLPIVKKVKMILLTRLVRRGWLQYREDLGLKINIPGHTLIDYLLEEMHTVNIKPEGTDPWILIVAWGSFGSRQLTSLKNLCSLPWLQISASINDNIELWIFLMLRVINILNLWTVFTIFFPTLI